MNKSLVPPVIVFRMLAAVLFVLLVQTVHPAQAWAEGTPGIRYQLAVTEDLSEVQVQASFPDDGRPLFAPEGEIHALVELEGCTGEKVRTRNGRIQTSGTSGCIRYRYPLNAQSGRRSPPVLRGVRVATPGEWLWTPTLGTGEFIRIDLAGSESMGISVPWTPLTPSGFELRPSPGSSTGTAVFGSFTPAELPVGEATLRVAALDGPGLALDEGKVLDWLTVAATDVASVGGSFPNPDLQVIVQPVNSRGRSPVPFGYVIRDGGETVRFYVDPGRSLADYLADWTATHEFSHLLLPYVRSREKWVSEGFASYYQNVLLARRGAYTEVEVWSRLARSFERADQVSNPPALNRLHERSFRDMRMLVYWSGAAMALIADVRLRERSGGRESLDTVLGALAGCCLPSERRWTAEELFEKLDTLSSQPIFMPLYREFMGRRGMPDMAGYFAALGIVPNGEGVQLTGEGRLSMLREAIMRPTEN